MLRGTRFRTGEEYACGAYQVKNLSSLFAWRSVRTVIGCSHERHFSKSLGYRELLIAHLLRECGSMSEFCDWMPGKATNDHGFAFGIAQWHICYREYDWAHAPRPDRPNGYCWKVNGKMQYRFADAPRMRDEYFASHPEMTDWRGQAKRYLAEIRDNLPRYGSVDAVIDSWNAGDSYMANVYAKKDDARKLLDL
jgi:hypothetical protein